MKSISYKIDAFTINHTSKQKVCRMKLANKAWSFGLHELLRKWQLGFIQQYYSTVESKITVKGAKSKAAHQYNSIVRVILTPGSSKVYFISTNLQNTYWCIGNTLDYKVAPSFHCSAQIPNVTNALQMKIRINSRKIDTQYSNLPLFVLQQIL